MPQDTRISVSLLLLRCIAGVAFILHGWKKIQNPFAWMGADSSVPAIFQALAALAEFGGGIAWILGALTPLASLGILATMAVAVSKHYLRGDPFVGRGGFELALVYFGIAILFLTTGPGRYSLDQWFLSSLFRRGARSRR